MAGAGPSETASSGSSLALDKLTKSAWSIVRPERRVMKDAKGEKCVVVERLCGGAITGDSQKGFAQLGKPGI